MNGAARVSYAGGPVACDRTSGERADQVSQVHRVHLWRKRARCKRVHRMHLDTPTLFRRFITIHPAARA